MNAYPTTAQHPNQGERPQFGPTTPVVWPLSADDAASLRAKAAALLDHVVVNPRLPPADIGRALTRLPLEGGRRAVVIGSDEAELVAGLASLAAGEAAPGVVTGRTFAGSAVFLYSGQGSQWRGMARELMASAPGFADSVRDCSAELERFTDWSAVDLLAGSDWDVGSAGPDVVQPALFAVMVALTRLWRACGVEPAALIGHSLGEVVAAEVSGALSTTDAARVVALWSKAQATLTGKGEMVFVMLPEHEVRARLARWGDRLGVAAVNGPNAVIVSGDADAADELLGALLDEDVFARRADVGLAAHSSHVDEIVPRMRADLTPVRPRSPGLPLYSGLYGRALDGEPLDAEHWCHNLRRTVHFQQAVEAALVDGHRILVEVSPHPVLTTDVAETARSVGIDAVARETLRRDDGGLKRFLLSAAEVNVSGVLVDWDAVLAAHAGGVASLPRLR
jgi:acyl transferase domain-containing protein